MKRLASSFSSPPILRPLFCNTKVKIFEDMSVDLKYQGNLQFLLLSLPYAVKKRHESFMTVTFERIFWIYYSASLTYKY